MKSYKQNTVLKKNDGLLQIHKYMNIKIQKEIIVVINIIYKFYIQF